MTTDDREKEPAFKVVDRRRFTDAGDEASRDAPLEEETRVREIPAQNATNNDSDEKVGRPKLSFSLFVQSLAHQTMMGLGMVPWPDSGLVRMELGLAKETIDILQILKEKTVNNLSKDEERMLDNLLYQLKLAYVEIVKKPPSGNASIIS